jgi:DNA (cytosine-5)-methyltransferase 1
MNAGRHQRAGHDNRARRGGAVSRPAALVYFCCQGGACKGLEDAGFDVTPVDIVPQPHHYAPEKVVVADALAHLRGLIDTGEIRRYALVAGSPPCQRKTRCQKIQGREHPALIAPFRQLCLESGLPYVIENVVPDGEDDDPLINPVLLCGSMFGLHTYRHRLFESNVPLVAPEHPRHAAPTVKMGRPVRAGDWYHAVGNFSGVDYVRADMGVPWMTREGIRECIPPVFAEYAGRQLMAHVGLARVLS